MESKKIALTRKTLYDIAKYGPPEGQSLLGSNSVLVPCVFGYGLITAKMGFTTKLIFLTHCQADRCFWLFFQEYKWVPLSHLHVISSVRNH